MNQILVWCGWCRMYSDPKMKPCCKRAADLFVKATRGCAGRREGR